MKKNNWQFWIDRGGTFTDVLGRSPEGEVSFTKVLSNDEAPITGIKKILERRGISFKKNQRMTAAEIRMGTTIATNALLERKGRRHALVITKGFASALQIGTQQRPDIFSLAIHKPSVLYDQVVEIDERLTPKGKVIQCIDKNQVLAQLRRLRKRGIHNIAVCLLNGYIYPRHERFIAQLAKKEGFDHISCSHEVCPQIGLTARGDTTTVDAYLTPLISAYLQHLSRRLPGSQLKMMQSNGGLIDASQFRGHNSIVSGPAAGVVAAAKISEWFGYKKIISFDMGGTSTDVARFEGDYQRIYEGTCAGVRIKAPMMKINTVAAGGGSVCAFKGGRLTVGPESAGSDPGPLCYGLVDKNGKNKANELTVCDVNFYLGRLLTDNFPFPLHKKQVVEKLKAITKDCGKHQQQLSPEEVAEGFLKVINQHMAQAIKKVSVAEGRDVRDYVLCCFGGAAAQHACAVARNLGVRRVLLHPLGGILSAYGMGLADIIWLGSSPVMNLPLNVRSLNKLEKKFDTLIQTGRNILLKEGLDERSMRFIKKMDLRYQGTETPITVNEPKGGDYARAFVDQHKRLYGYIRHKREIEILQIRLEARGRTDCRKPKRMKLHAQYTKPFKYSDMHVNGRKQKVPVYRRKDLKAGFKKRGPALILEDISTVVVEDDFHVLIDTYNNLHLECIIPARRKNRDASLAQADPISLEIFNNLFMSIAEQMGEALRRTAVSTNIKERLDYSCALFDANGFLVANAPHIPVHLGAMGETVRCLINDIKKMSPGDVFVTNIPAKGGTHLPDITVITPVYLKTSDKSPTFYTASRAHHADVGGITPGSMPALSRSITDEGIIIDQIKLVDQGRFNEKLFKTVFTQKPNPVRNLKDNLLDLQAQMAANHQGVELLKDLVIKMGNKTVQAYMGHVRDNAHNQVREALGRFKEGVYQFTDTLDDQTPIHVSIKIKNKQARIDFTGTGQENDTNLNAPLAVTKAAVLYVLRVLVQEPIPLNDGCLLPVELIVPAGCILNPSSERAVAGGNVETSQRVVDCLLGALGVAAASQGTMNNISFGDEHFGYYETIGGGAGATASEDGADAVHTHMTNTRVTDPEILEVRHPLRLTEFNVRKNSGGRGRYKGGCGIVRTYHFLKPLQVSLLSQRRRKRPYGIRGGGSGKKGMNVRVFTDGRAVALDGICTYLAQKGEQLIIKTPGGGAYGK